VTTFVSRTVLLWLFCLPSLVFGQPDVDSLVAHEVGEAKARIVTIEQELDAWNTAAAKKELEGLQQLVPADSKAAQFYAGRVAFEEGRYEAAVDAFEKAGAGPAISYWKQLAKDTLAIVGDYQKQESAHFVVLYPKGKDELLVPYALDTLEAQRTALERDLGYAPPEKIRLEFVTSGLQLSKVSTLSVESIRTTGTIAICKFGKLMVTSPKAVVKGYDWLDTVAHEFVHLVVSRKSNNRVPIWMHEGLAKYLESRWRGAAGEAMTPSHLAILGSRVRNNTLIPFEKMHPSMALLPTAEDAATAFAEVFFAIAWLDKETTPRALPRLLELVGSGVSDKNAVEKVTERKWSEFEKSWMAYLKRQPFPKELIPRSSNDKRQLQESEKAPAKKKQREISFGDFAEVSETDARKHAHLGELFRERNRIEAAAAQYAMAVEQVQNRYESVSNKYALTLMALKQHDLAEKVLLGCLKNHPASASTHVHLGRIALAQKNNAKAAEHALRALAVDPFDPEIHAQLYVSSPAKSAARKRAARALSLLSQLPEERIPGLIQRFFDDSFDAAPDAG
jgi:tetratricopeptide (TPR) repeat protein